MPGTDTHKTGIDPYLLEKHVRTALDEDLGRAGDITTDSIIPAETKADVVLRARQKGCVAGLALAAMAFRLLDADVNIEFVKQDGDVVAPGDTLMRISGKARAILSAERVALNYVGHLSGIASITHDMVAAMGDTSVRLTCTRKTTPGLRALEKYAVRCGGGYNHRFGLDDAVLIKDNHIAVAGDIQTAISRAKAANGHMVKIEVEIDTLDQLKSALEVGVDVVLLDNMPPEMLKQAVEITAGRAVLEASGGITPDSVGAIAQTGVDVISAGWLTHSAPSLDVGLDDAAAVRANAA